MSEYSKPGQVGGQLIRDVIQFWRAQGDMPQSLSPLISAHILIAVSGGVDSMALAQLLIKYGRKVASPGKIRILHINHRWRGEESDGDEEFVRRAARSWGVPITIVKLKPPIQKDGSSLEDCARRARKRIFNRLAEKYNAQVLTAHHADDLAETLIWRILTGTASTHGAGIQFQNGVEIRPLLKIRKSVLKSFMAEEGQSWREDRTNFETRFLRSRLRAEAMPALEKIFPRMVERLGEQAFSVQSDSSTKATADISLLFGAAGLELRRAHHQILKNLRDRVEAGKTKRGEWNFEKGWKLRWENFEGTERWILERT